MHVWGVRGPNFHLVIGPIGDAAEMQQRCRFAFQNRDPLSPQLEKYKKIPEAIEL